MTFQGSGSDPEDGALSGSELAWTSDLDGPIGTGSSFTRSDLSVGAHTVTLKATDSKRASGSATVRVTVKADQPPAASITSPAGGSSYEAGQPISFEGSANDPEDGALTGSSLVWTSDVDGQLGTGASFSRSDLSVSTHEVVLTATDSHGNAASDTVTIDVTPGPPASLTTAPHLIRFGVGDSRSLDVDVRDAEGNQIDNPGFQVDSRDSAVATISGTRVDGVSEGVTDVVISSTTGSAVDSSRVAVVATDGFAAVVTSDTSEFESGVSSGSTVTVRLYFLSPPGGSGNLGSYQGDLTWDPARLEYQSSSAVASGWSYTPNETNVAGGQLTFAAFSATGQTGSFALVELTFQVTGSASAQPVNLDLATSTAGNDVGDNITSLIQTVDSDIHIQ